MQKYSIQPGRSNFRPIDWPGVIWKPKGFELTVNFDESCYYTLDELQGDKDFYDWNKLIGLTNFWTWNDNDSIMVAWRPSSSSSNEDKLIELCLYVNPKDGRFFTTDTLTARCGVDTNFEVSQEGKYIYFDGSKKYTRLEYSFPKLCRWVGTSFGGANNSPGAYGGSAHKYMEYMLMYSRL